MRLGAALCGLSVLRQLTDHAPGLSLSLLARLAATKGGGGAAQQYKVPHGARGGAVVARQGAAFARTVQGQLLRRQLPLPYSPSSHPHPPASPHPTRTHAQAEPLPGSPAPTTWLRCLSMLGC